MGVELLFGKHISHPIYVSTINQCKAKQPGNQKAAETSVEGRAIMGNSSLNNNSVFPMGLLVHIISVHSMETQSFLCRTGGSSFPNNLQLELSMEDQVEKQKRSILLPLFFIWHKPGLVCTFALRINGLEKESGSDSSVRS